MMQISPIRSAAVAYQALTDHPFFASDAGEPRANQISE
jgi:hypothetical protein